MGNCPTDYNWNDPYARKKCKTVHEKAFQDLDLNNSEDDGQIVFDTTNNSVKAVKGSSAISCFDNVSSLEELSDNILQSIENNTPSLDQCEHTNTDSSETFSRDGQSVTLQSIGTGI